MGNANSSGPENREGRDGTEGFPERKRGAVKTQSDVEKREGCVLEREQQV